MWHATYTQLNQGDSWLLMLGSKTSILTPDPFFGHHFCIKYSNGTCEPILDMYVSRTFQKWQKALKSSFETTVVRAYNNYIKRYTMNVHHL
jgi:hypothetical protein